MQLGPGRLKIFQFKVYKRTEGDQGYLRAFWPAYSRPGAQSVLAVAGSKEALPQAQRYPQFKHLHLWDQLILFY